MMPNYRAKYKPDGKRYSVGKMDSKSVWLWMRVLGSLDLIECSWNEIILEESSRIQDKNKKEIFEGDSLFASMGVSAQGRSEFEIFGKVKRELGCFFLVEETEESVLFHPLYEISDNCELEVV